MQLYHYSRLTGELGSQTTARKSPLFDASIHPSSEEFLIPANTTIVAPPIVGTSEVACFNDNAWEKKADYRGEIYYDKITKQPIEITEIGITPDETVTAIEPTEYVNWDTASGAWVIDMEEWLSTSIRPQRDNLLNQVDIKYCNSEKWENMTQTKKTAWSAYKQLLRELPETIDYNNPIWPTQPV